MKTLNDYTEPTEVERNFFSMNIKFVSLKNYFGQLRYRSKWKRANRVYIGDSENQHLISLNAVFKREWAINGFISLFEPKFISKNTLLDDDYFS